MKFRFTWGLEEMALPEIVWVRGLSVIAPSDS
jgi:hypothetical protein